MKTAAPFAIALLLATATAATAQTTPAPSSTPASTSTSTPAPSASTTLPGVAATTGNPNLAVASIKLDNGVRVSKIVGATVFTTDAKDLGKIDDLVMTKGDEITLAVVSVGGFLGVGSKLVAFPYKDLKHDGDRLVLPGVTADSLNAMPSFEY